jgi:hypothetical protein
MQRPSRIDDLASFNTRSYDMAVPLLLELIRYP